MRGVRVGVIGCGYWGPNLVRNFVRHPLSQVEAVCDVRYERAARLGSEYHIPTVTDRTDEVLRAPDINAIVIATPSYVHYELAKIALQEGKHVLVMKPITTRLADAEELCDVAARQGLLLAVDHTCVFTGAVRRMIVGGSKRMMIYDDMEPSEKLKVYDKGFSIGADPGVEREYQLMISYRSGDMHAPQLDAREALAVEVDNVVQAILGRESLVVDGRAGARVVRILEGAQRSIDQGGAVVAVNGTAVPRNL